MRFGLVQRAQDAWDFSPMVPFLVLVFPPVNHPDITRPGTGLRHQNMDLSVRVLSLNMIHKSVNVTVSVAITAAALLPDSLVFEASGGAARGGELRIAHPSGITTTSNCTTPSEGGVSIDSVQIGRTTRRIMQGEILVQPHRIRWLYEAMGK